MQVQVNGEEREVANQLKLSELVSELSLAPERVAIELNKHVVRRNQWPATTLADGDRIEIVHFVGGGSAVGSSPREIGTLVLQHSLQSCISRGKGRRQ